MNIKMRLVIITLKTKDVRGKAAATWIAIAAMCFFITAYVMGMVTMYIIAQFTGVYTWENVFMLGVATTFFAGMFNKMEPVN